jgi:hypothetical protein
MSNSIKILNIGARTAHAGIVGAPRMVTAAVTFDFFASGRAAWQYKFHHARRMELNAALEWSASCRAASVLAFA